jgi:hypothetical protein
LGSIKKSLKKRNKPRYTTGMDGMKTKTENIESSFRLILKCLKTGKRGEKRRFSSD